MSNKMDKTPNSSKAFKKWVARIDSLNNTWTQSELIYLRKAIGHCGLNDPAERALLFSLFNRKCAEATLRILPEHDLLGQNYLLSKSLMKNGKPRKRNILSEEQLNVMKVLDHHTIDGLKRCAGNNIFPVYTAYGKNGNWFSYTGCMYEHMEIVGDGNCLLGMNEVNYV